MKTTSLPLSAIDLRKFRELAAPGSIQSCNSTMIRGELPQPVGGLGKQPVLAAFDIDPGDKGRMSVRDDARHRVLCFTFTPAPSCAVRKAHSPSAGSTIDTKPS
jgi:hypothetical protein